MGSLQLRPAPWLPCPPLGAGGSRGLPGGGGGRAAAPRAHRVARRARQGEAAGRGQGDATEQKEELHHGDHAAGLGEHAGVRPGARDGGGG